MRIARAETLALSAIVGTVFVFYAWSGRFWIDVVDEGYFLDLSSRVLHGALPYRDFDSVLHARRVLPVCAES